LIIRSPWLSWTASRKSSTPLRLSGPKKYIEVSGATPAVRHVHAGEQAAVDLHHRLGARA
jgi:hypothetical protein